MIKIVQIPYQISGTITDSAGSNPSGALVTATNNTNNGETTTINTDGNGFYILDLANMATDYAVGDSITIVATPTTERGTSSFTIASGEQSKTVNITTASFSEARYCTIQEVRDQLDGVSTDDISDLRVENSILRGEAEIDLRTKSSFKSNTITDEFYDTSNENMWTSPQRGLGLNVNTSGSRADRGFGWNLDVVRLRNSPIIAVTSFSRNTASDNKADTFEVLTEQSGSGGDFILDKNRTTLTFLNNKPYFGRTRAFKVSYTWGLDRTATDNETVRKMALARELCVLLAVRQILMSKSNTSHFSGLDPLSLESISLQSGIVQGSTYLRYQKERIDELYALLGEHNISMGLV